MKQLLVLSGKGGTGKTTVASALIALLQAPAYADCDVDAPNLHLVTNQQTLPQMQDFFGLKTAQIEGERCNGCSLCAQSCRFGAIRLQNGVAQVDSFACEGCSLCARLCPEGAIQMQAQPTGRLMLFQQPDQTFSTARLHMGKGTSGLLVTEVKNQMKQHAPPDSPLAVIDGSPGIGCPVIASLSGVDMVLLVAEPSVSGLHDLQRVLKTARHFAVPALVCVNKWDTHPGITQEIIAFCQQENLPFVGKIPYDDAVVETVNQGRNIMDVACPAASAITGISQSICQLLNAM